MGKKNKERSGREGGPRAHGGNGGPRMKAGAAPLQTHFCSVDSACVAAVQGRSSPLQCLLCGHSGHLHLRHLPFPHCLTTPPLCACLHPVLQGCCLQFTARAAPGPKQVNGQDNWGPEGRPLLLSSPQPEPCSIARPQPSGGRPQAETRTPGGPAAGRLGPGG